MSTADMAMLDFVAQMTRDATKMTAANVTALRDVGFDDRAILQLSSLASWFNYINRMADAFGLGR